MRFILVGYLQGDVIGILDKDGDLLVKYVYDAYGVPTVSFPGITSSMTDAQKQEIYILGSNNPFRYRGYYFDTETGFYYLNSRYYDPVTGRFLNADAVLDTSVITGCNMFAYCGNNPIKYVDPTGHCRVNKYGELECDYAFILERDICYACAGPDNCEICAQRILYSLCHYKYTEEIKTLKIIKNFEKEATRSSVKNISNSIVTGVKKGIEYIEETKDVNYVSIPNNTYAIYSEANNIAETIMLPCDVVTKLGLSTYHGIKLVIATVELVFDIVEVFKEENSV
jgi:RHS repeat-associated protein